jgi:hypothetical protein
MGIRDNIERGIEQLKRFLDGAPLVDSVKEHADMQERSRQRAAELDAEIVNDTRARMGRIALVTNFVRGGDSITGRHREIADTAVGTLGEVLSDDLKAVVLDVFIGGNKAQRIGDFVSSRTLLSAALMSKWSSGIQIAETEGVHGCFTGGFNLEPAVLLDRADEVTEQATELNDLQREDVGYVAIGSVLELRGLGVPIEADILRGAHGAVYEDAKDGQILVPSEENPLRWVMHKPLR